MSMIDLNITSNIGQLIDMLAKLRGVTTDKVVRNASRDFVQATYKETPLAQKSKSEYYTFVGKDGNRRYLHESQVTVKRKSKLRKVRIRRGWSRASWIGIMRGLGMSTKSRPRALPSKVETISNVIVTGTPERTKATMTDHIRFNRWGRSQDHLTEHICQEGFKLAAERMTKAFRKSVIEAIRK